MVSLPPPSPTISYSSAQESILAPVAGSSEASRFEAVLSGPSNASNFASRPVEQEGLSIGTLINQQSDLFKSVVGDMRKARDSAKLDKAEMVAAGINLMTSMAASNMHFTACTSLAQGVKNAAQTLLKNQ
jgi:hypothetical protein